MIDDPRIRTLLRQAEKNASFGKRDAALMLYRQILAEMPEAETAWLGVADLTPSVAEKEAAYRQVLALNGTNERAQAYFRGEFVPPLTAAFLPEPLPVEGGAAPATAVAPDTPPPPAPWQPTLPPPPLPVAEAPKTAVAHDQPLTCYRHPQRATSLRCYSCGKPICTQCAIKTPVGYRCPDCIREAEDTFFNAKPTDYLIALAVSLPLSLVAGFILMQVSGGFYFILLILLIGGAVGGFIGRMTKRAVGRRRGRYLPHLVSAMVILGGMIAAVPALIFLLSGSTAAVTGLIVPGVYSFVASSAAFYQMK